VVLMLLGGTAGAQSPEEARAPELRRPMERVYLNLDAAYHSEEHLLVQRLSTPLYDETRTFEARHASPVGVGFGAALGVRVWNNLAVGLGGSYFRIRNAVDVAGHVPHPLFYRRPRETEHQPGGFDRTEVGVHLQVVWTIRLADRLDVALSAGPSVFRVELDRVSTIRTDEVGPPYDAVRVDIGRALARKDLAGANAGIDLTYHLFRSMEPGASFWAAGVGIFVRWTTGTSALPEFGPDETIEVGGLQVGAGLRFRF